MGKKVISTHNLEKVIKGKQILSGISVEINSGDCVALIGPNGAGKTTLMNCLQGRYRVSSTQVQIKGLPPCHRHLQGEIAVLSQDNCLPHHLKVTELVHFFKAIANQPLTDEEIDAYLGFSQEQKQQLAEKLSGGQKRLLSFVLCLIGRPAILFLDEPTSGMDTTTRQHFWEIIAQLKAKGVTIIYSSHYIEEVEHTAERILVLHQGHLLRDTTPFAMRNENQEKQVTLSSDFKGLITALTDVYDVVLKGDTVQFRTKTIDRVWQELQAGGCCISDLEVQNKTLLDSLFDSAKEADKC
ncbi:ABC transporter ATP-binding protein [Streptococcus halichoeri]|uniref:ABC transporter ATP-binding protein n=1 Tax=Streptococcus halichoeri TaxID=254785 RepID=UPI0013589F16|nr:ABC transporter ATP-binding protein [Streptococcus halichoeri]